MTLHVPTSAGCARHARGERVLCHNRFVVTCAISVSCSRHLGFVRFSAANAPEHPMKQQTQTVLLLVIIPTPYTYTTWASPHCLNLGAGTRYSASMGGLLGHKAHHKILARWTCVHRHHSLSFATLRPKPSALNPKP